MYVLFKRQKAAVQGLNKINICTVLLYINSWALDGLLDL